MKSFERVCGTPGQPGAVSKLTFEENEREFSLIEKIRYRDGPNRFDGVYENEFADNAIENRFIEEGELRTLWILETEYKFKTLLMRILDPAMKRNLIRRTYREMERFKELAESLSSSK